MKHGLWVPVAAVVVVLMLTRLDMDTSTVMVAVVVGGTLGVVLTVMLGSTSSRHRAVVAAHPGQEVIEVWGAAGLHQGLVAQGVDRPRVRKRQGTALSMVLGPQGVELWRGSRPRLVVAVPWTDLVGAYPDDGIVANNGPQPAVTLFTRQGAGLTLCPAAKPTGSLRTAPAARVRELVDHVNAQVENAKHG